jgi:glycosyltransferase involved in cell wall biosynthesis
MNPVWISAVSRFIREGRFSLVIVRDLPLSYLVGTIGKRENVPVVLDMAENYPAALKAYRNILYKPFLVGNSWLPKQYEKASLKRISHVLVVTDESAHRLATMGTAPSLITVVGNTPENQFIPATIDGETRIPETNETQDLNLLFVGKIDAHRGVELAVRALPGLQRQFPELTLTLVGDGTQRVRLEQLCQSLSIKESVHFTGWVQFRDIWKHISESTICLIPHLRSEHTDTTLPNKLFDYMALGRPVVASDCSPMKRIIQETNCGLTFRSGDSHDLECAVRKLLVDSRLRQEAGSNGRRAVLNRYNWAVDRNLLLRTLTTSQRTSRAETPSVISA